MNDRLLWEVFYRSLMAMAKAIKKYKLSGDANVEPVVVDGSTSVAVSFDE